MSPNGNVPAEILEVLHTAKMIFFDVAKADVDAERGNETALEVLRTIAARFNECRRKTSGLGVVAICDAAAGRDDCHLVMPLAQPSVAVSYRCVFDSDGRGDCLCYEKSTEECLAESLKES